MQIKTLDPFILHVPVTRGGIADSTHSITHWGMPGVIITTDTGHKGYGYCGTHAHLPTDRLITSAITDTFGPMLIGQDPRQAQELFDTMARSGIHIWVGRAGVMQLALSAVDIALWDLKAKAADQTLWQLLGANADKKILGYNTDGGWLNWSDQQLVDDCKRMTEVDGFSAVKMKIGKPDPNEDLARVEKVRTAIGRDAKLMVDANGKWTLAEGIEYGGRLADFDITWFEEPLWHDDVSGHAKLAAAIKTPIALGEMLYNIDQFRQFIEAEAVYYVQPDVVRVGGVTPWWRIAELIASHELKLAPHHGDMMQAQLQLCIAHQAGYLLEFIPWTLECFEEPVAIEAGIYSTPSQPGAGTTLRDDALRKFNVLK